jgi:hypothetical protein
LLDFIVERIFEDLELGGVIRRAVACHDGKIVRPP